MDDADGDDAYEVLGVADTATDAEIERAFKRKIRMAHPDVVGGDEERAKRLNWAHSVLRNNRVEYDRSRRERRQKESTPADLWDRFEDDYPGESTETNLWEEFDEFEDAQTREPTPTDLWDESDDAQARESTSADAWGRSSAQPKDSSRPRSSNALARAASVLVLLMLLIPIIFHKTYFIPNPAEHGGTLDIKLDFVGLCSAGLFAATGLVVSLTSRFWLTLRPPRRVMRAVFAALAIPGFFLLSFQAFRWSIATLLDVILIAFKGFASASQAGSTQSSPSLAYQILHALFYLVCCFGLLVTVLFGTPQGTNRST